MEVQSSERLRGPGKNKRVWHANEDTVLVHALVDLCNTGWKSDNGTFRTGYMSILEKTVKTKFPGCGLKATPHIESRLKTLKKQYYAISDMLKNSDFVWNDDVKCAMCEKDDGWNDWLKSHPEAKGLRNKPFPHFEELARVFGRDVANGERSQAPEDMVEAMDNEDENNEDINVQDGGLEDIDVLAIQTFGDMSTGSKGSKQPRRKRSRDIGNFDAGFMELAKTFGTLCAETNMRIDKLASRLGCEHDATQRRGSIDGVLMENQDLVKGDKLILRGLMFHGFHGVRAEEKKLGQKFLVDVDAWIDLREAGKTDCLSNTVSYTDIYRIVKEIIEGPSQNLLESVAQLIANTTITKFPQITAVRVKVGKPHVAAVHGPLDYLGVEILRFSKDITTSDGVLC
ncbi:uncharacterized protein LOC143889253 [Tasmannia lanceolata]|uniref:uncharacterized protein LOC143889253 n=1 Tax=Tasmannia lanceolata TaxID=3420 RepID=UPI0040648B12